jgi:hypothetical protein
MEYKEALRYLLALQRGAGLILKIRNVNDGERVSAFDNPTIASRELSQHLAGPQDRQRTVQTAQIERYRRTPKIIRGGALDFGLREGKGCGLQVPEDAAGIRGGRS